VKLWNYQHGGLMDDVDCSAYIDSDNDADAGDCNTASCRSDPHRTSKDIRCMASSHRLLAVSFNG